MVSKLLPLIAACCVAVTSFHQANAAVGSAALRTNFNAVVGSAPPNQIVGSDDETVDEAKKMEIYDNLTFNATVSELQSFVSVTEEHLNSPQGIKECGTAITTAVGAIREVVKADGWVSSKNLSKHYYHLDLPKYLVLLFATAIQYTVMTFASS